MGIRDHPVAARSPWQNGQVERLIGTSDCSVSTGYAGPEESASADYEETMPFARPAFRCSTQGNVPVRSRKPFEQSLIDEQIGSDHHEPFIKMSTRMAQHLPPVAFVAF